MQWAKNVARMGRGAYRIVRKPSEKDHFEDVGIGVT